MTRRPHRTTMPLLWLALLTLMPLRAASAHSFDPALLALGERRPGAFDVVWKFPGGPGTESDAVAPEFPAHCRRLDPLPSNDGDDRSAAYWQIDCGIAGLRGERIAVHGLAGLRADVVIRITWLDGSASTGVLQTDADQFTVRPARHDAGARVAASVLAVLASYVRLGIAHILLGVDHLLFVLGLLLLIQSRRLLVKTITAFTIAHSAALALAVLGVVTPPAAPVEALIALSIVLVALELTRAPDAPPTLTARYPWGVAFAFGLVHGLGFAGALAEIGLPAGQVPLALFGFNVGVEIGQLAFVLVMLLPLRALARLTSRWPGARWVPAYAIGTVAVAWVLERIERFWMPLN